MDIAKCIQWGFQNFGFVMFILAVLCILVNRMTAPPYMMNAEIVYRWIALLPVGITSLYAFMLHAFFPVISASSIGWLPSPFQFEVAMANLAFGIIAILSFKASYGFRLATTIALVIWYWGDAVGHSYQIIRFHNLSAGNAGTWFWLDLFLPIILLVSILRLKQAQKPFRIK